MERIVYMFRLYFFSDGFKVQLNSVGSWSDNVAAVNVNGFSDISNHTLSSCGHFKGSFQNMNAW